MWVHYGLGRCCHLNPWLPCELCPCSHGQCSSPPSFLPTPFPSRLRATWLVIRRQALLNLVRQRAFIIARSIEAAIQALIMGSMLFGITPGTTTWRKAFAACVVAVNYVTLMSAPQLILVFNTKRC